MVAAKRSADNVRPPSGDTPAAVAFPLIVFECEEYLVRRYRHDPDKLAVAEDAIAKLRVLCSALTGKRFLDAEGGDL